MSEPYDRMLANAPAALAKNDENVAGLAEEGSVPENTDNPYPKYRQDRCVHCAAGKAMGSHRSHLYFDLGTLTRPECTAPTPEAYIAELEEKIHLLVYGWRMETTKLACELDEWRTKALDVETHPVVVALRAERDEARAALSLAVGALEKILASRTNDAICGSRCRCVFCIALAAMETK